MENKKLSSLVLSHLQQIGLFLWRTGIEIYPLKDTESRDVETTVKRFLSKNKVSLYYDDIWWRGAISGEILVYLLPSSPGNYRFLYYPKECFDYVCNDLTGELELVVIKVNNKVYEISRDSFKTWDNEKLGLSRSPDRVIFNNYNLIPCVVIQNKPVNGNRGENEFGFLEDKIKHYDYLVDAITSNIDFFGSPIFATSLSKAEIIEKNFIQVSGVAEAYGFGNFKSDVKVKPKRIIAGVEPDDVLKFLNPESMSNEILNWVNDLEAGLRYSLGGVPIRMPPNDALFQEADINYRYAPAIVTSKRRAETYITYGLVEVLYLVLRMSAIDKKIDLTSLPIEEVDLQWRYKGEVFPPSALDRLNKSIVARNLIRLGVNLQDSMQHIFPDLSRVEIEKMLEKGFAYEYLNGMSSVASKYPIEYHPDIYNITEKLILDEVNRSHEFSHKQYD